MPVTNSIYLVLPTIYAKSYAHSTQPPNNSGSTIILWFPWKVCGLPTVAKLLGCPSLHLSLSPRLAPIKQRSLQYWWEAHRNSDNIITSDLLSSLAEWTDWTRYFHRLSNNLGPLMEQELPSGGNEGGTWSWNPMVKGCSWRRNLSFK